MKQKGFSATEIMQILKQAAGGIPFPNYALRMACVLCVFTNGAVNMAAWMRHDRADEGDGEATAEEDICRDAPAEWYVEGGFWKKVASPSRRKALARWAVDHKQISLRLAGATFSLWQICYRYQPRLRNEKAEIEHFLLRLTDTHKRWGFGLCFLYLGNVKGFGWHHKRVSRIYRDLELNLRTKPRKRLKRARPDPLNVPNVPNEVWSMDFMAGKREDGRAFHSFNILDDFNREGPGV